MKLKCTHSVIAKTVAIVLFLAFALSALCTGAGVALFATDGLYTGEKGSVASTNMAADLADRYAHDAYLVYAYGKTEYAEDYGVPARMRRLDPANTNFRYSVTDAAGKQIGGTLGSEPVSDMIASIETVDEASGQSVIIRGYIVKDLTAADAFRDYANVFDRLYPARHAMIAYFALSVLAGVLLLVFLCCAAGRHADSAEPRLGLLDRIPFDLYLAVTVALIACLCAGGISAAEEPTVLTLSVLAICYVLCALLCVALLMTVAARVKLHTFWQNMIITWCFRKIGAFLRWIGSGLTVYWSNRRLLTRVLLAIIFLAIAVPSLTVSAEHSGLAALILMGLGTAVTVFAARTALRLEKLYHAGSRLAAGDFSERIDTDKFRGYLKQHAENLNSIQIGASRAVDARMKSERMKTDLITNVSHDLKTPLTSIVNYVDLLQKEDLQNETAASYVEVLARQAEKLKKLTVDLVEASKASSGTINAQLAPTNVLETVNQSLAEYAERFQKAELTPIATLPDGEISVIADGRLLWRVLDNLLSNTVKYALPGTRVYVDAAAIGSDGIITVKNVSREALNIPVEELMERFVRGDASRATEGSGLGLSIAKSLAELMHGTLTLSISGDLFTASLQLPLAR